MLINMNRESRFISQVLSPSLTSLTCLSLHDTNTPTAFDKLTLAYKEVKMGLGFS